MSARIAIVSSARLSTDWKYRRISVMFYEQKSEETKAAQQNSYQGRKKEKRKCEDRPSRIVCRLFCSYRSTAHTCASQAFDVVRRSYIPLRIAFAFLLLGSF